MTNNGQETVRDLWSVEVCHFL